MLPANHVRIGNKHSRDVSLGGPTLPEAPSYTIEMVRRGGIKASNHNSQLLETHWGIEKDVATKGPAPPPTIPRKLIQSPFYLTKFQ